MAGFLEQLYPLAPVWAQNLGISAYGFFWRNERLGGRLDDYVAQFRDRETWSADRFRQYLQAELRGILAHAFTHVPYYASAWKAVGISSANLADFDLSSLSKFPTTPKSKLREDPDAFVSRTALHREKLKRFNSSGTTGTPITSVCTTDIHRRFIAAREARSFGWAGTSLLKPRSMIGGRLVVPKAHSTPPFHRYNWAEKQVYFSAYHISPANTRHFVAALNQHKPCVLTGYAYSHFLLARMMLDQNLSLAYEPDALVLGSEKLTPEMKAVLLRAFRARAFEEYGCVENCALATECEHGRLHVSPDFGIVEIVDDQNHPVPAGVEGRILATGLLNDVQPLIRYDIGDRAAWSPQPCPCGRNHLPVLQEVVGRLEDVVTGPDGRQLVRFHGIFVNLPHVLEGQVIQEALDRFTVKIVAQPGFDEHEERVIKHRFIERLGQVQVQIKKVPAIPRTERGKFRAVISKLKPGPAAEAPVEAAHV